MICLKKAVFITLLSFLVVVHVLQLLPLVTAQTIEEPTDSPVTVSLAIRIYEIDQEKRCANISILAQINDYPDNESEIDVRISGAGYAYCNCTRGDQRPNGWFFIGESNKITWTLDGNGELFPFDAYYLRFRIEQVGKFQGLNCTLADGEQQAFFAGTEIYYLRNLWKEPNSLLPIASMDDQEIRFTLQRSDNSVIIAFLEFFVPPIACYYLLGSALILDPKQHLAERLRIFLSLFFFVPAFLITIQTFFPYRTSLAFPEMLLVNLLVSTAVLGIFSILGKQYELSTDTIIDEGDSPKPFERRMDFIGIAIAMSFFITIYHTTLFGKLNLILLIFLTYLIIPAYAFWIPLAKTRRYRITRKMIFSLLIGIIPSILMYLVALAFSLVFGYVVTVGGIIVGIIVGFYVKSYTRSAALAFVDGVIGTIISGIIAGLLSGDGIFETLQLFGVIGSLFACYAGCGAIVAYLVRVVSFDLKRQKS